MSKLTRFPHGIMATPVVGAGNNFTTGNVFFVDDSGSNSNDGQSPDHPFKTLDYAIGRCTASQGDTIYVMPGHAETATASMIVCDVIGISIIGLGYGRMRPAFTGHASAVDIFSVTAASTHIENVRIIGAASGTTALINIAASDVVIKNCVLEHGAVPLTAVTVASGDRWVIDGCKFVGTAANPDYCVDIEAHCADWIIQNCVADYVASAGLDLAFVRSNVDAQPGGMILNNFILGCDTLFVDINSSANAGGDGLVANNFIGMGAAVTSIEDIMDLGGWMSVGNLATDAATAAGATVPITTSS
jgi:hypothetical protein